MILNRQREVRVAQRPLQLFLRRLQEHLGLAAAEVTICLVSDAEIARMNEVFRKKRGPTDVLSFPAVARRKPALLPRGTRQGTALQVAKKGRPSFLQGLKPIDSGGFTPGLKPRPPKERPFSAACLAVPKGAANKRASAPKATRSPRRDIDATATSEYLGDVAISPVTARRNAQQFGRTLPNELQILMLHGVLHLLGYDHETDRGQMERYEQRLRRRFGLA
jgi:rRNA maturation RNase YbeY